MAIIFGGMMMRVVFQNCCQMEECIQDIVLSRNLTIVKTATLMCLSHGVAPFWVKQFTSIFESKNLFYILDRNFIVPNIAEGFV